MKIKCIALDMDRTTLNSQGKLSEQNRAAINGAIKQGIEIVIASGRAFSTLPREVIEIAGIEYAITANGAEVYHLPTGKCLKQFKLPAASVNQVIAATRAEPVAYEVFIEGRVYTDQRFAEHPEHYGLDRAAADYFHDIRKIQADMEAFMTANRSVINTLNIYVANAELKRRVWQLVAAAAAGVHITTSFPQLVEVISEQAGKHSGLKYVLGRLGVTAAETAAFGDNDNDKEMLAYAGCGIAMENASQRCREASDCQTIHHDNDGVAYGFREILGLDI